MSYLTKERRVFIKCICLVIGFLGFRKIVYSNIILSPDNLLLYVIVLNISTLLIKPNHEVDFITISAFGRKRIDSFD